MARKQSLFISFLTALLFPICNYSQEAPVANIDEAVLSTSDRTYLSFGQGFGNYKTTDGTKRLTPLIFEGQISPDFFLSLSKKRTIGLVFFPKVVVRMFNQNSFPVRTPSYMPSILFYQRIKWPFDKKIFGFFKSEKQLAFLTYRLLHHSNGQEGDYFLPGTDSVNYRNGNFSTNAVEVAFSWSTVDSGAVGKAFANGRIAYERQLDFARETELKNTYYYNKLIVESHINYSEKIKAYITYSFMWGTRSFGTRNSIDIFIVMKPLQKLANFSVFIRGFIGPDYYNIYYSNQLRALTVGIIADPLKMPVFKKAKKKQN